MWQHSYTRLPPPPPPPTTKAIPATIKIGSPSNFVTLVLCSIQQTGLSFKFLTLLLCSHCYTYNASTFNCKHTFYVCMMPNKHGPKVSNVVVHWTMHSTCCPDILIIQNYASIMGSRNNPNPHIHPTWECGISSCLQRGLGDKTTQWKYTYSPHDDKSSH